MEQYEIVLCESCGACFMDLQYTTECGACWDKYEGISPPSLSRKIINTINIVSKWIETAASSVISLKKNK